MMLTRREWLRTAGVGAAALLAVPYAAASDEAGFTLPPLPYPYDALEPAIDKQTMQIHHDKHHAAYVKNLNAALAKHPDWLTKPIDDVMRHLSQVPADVRTAVRNNGGGHYNHSLFWKMMEPVERSKASDEPSGNLASAIASTFGDMAKFKAAFKDAAMKRFGSGWAWLVKDGAGKLAITSTANQDTPLSEGKTPLLGIDVWEHAYYLKYQNRRNDYVDAWWSVVNWKTASHRFAA